MMNPLSWGIKVIIDWEKEGFEIAATAENGLEALEYLKKKKWILS